jgi:hypothetical protein
VYRLACERFHEDLHCDEDSYEIRCRRGKTAAKVAALLAYVSMFYRNRQ